MGRTQTQKETLVVCIVYCVRDDDDYYYKMGTQIYCKRTKTKKENLDSVLFSFFFFFFYHYPINDG